MMQSGISRGMCSKYSHHNTFMRQGVMQINFKCAKYRSRSGRAIGCHWNVFPLQGASPPQCIALLLAGGHMKKAGKMLGNQVHLVIHSELDNSRSLLRPRHGMVNQAAGRPKFQAYDARIMNMIMATFQTARSCTGHDSH